MAIIKKSAILEKYNVAQTTLLDDDAEVRYAAGRLKESFEAFSFSKTYDIFLSHSYSDSRVVKQIRDMLINKGYSVYVDWIEDKHLDRGAVSEHTAQIIKNRMNGCSSLIYLTSSNAENSVWMPWELGYMDAHTGLVAVAPIIDDDEEFEGREYLGIYPYLDLTEDNFYIQTNSSTWVNLQGWMKGEKPEVHNSI